MEGGAGRLPLRGAGRQRPAAQSVEGLSMLKSDNNKSGCASSFSSHAPLWHSIQPHGLPAFYVAMEEAKDAYDEACSVGR